MTGRQPTAIWLFDSHCVRCEGGVQFTLRYERAPTIRFVAVTSEEGRALARQNGLDPDDPTTFLFIEGGRALDRSDGVIALASHLTGPARLGVILQLLPKRLRDYGYSLIAKHRYRLFGRKNTCIVPGPDVRDRFTL